MLLGGGGVMAAKGYISSDFEGDAVNRYLLTRRWALQGVLDPEFGSADLGAPSLSRLWVVMSNPSIADHKHDDPTIRRVVNFAKREKFRGLAVLNLLPVRATDPVELVRGNAAVTHAGAIEFNRRTYLPLVAGNPVLVAWGAWARRVYPGLLLEACEALASSKPSHVWCLGKTKDGDPRHPLYVPKSRGFADFDLAEYVEALKQ